MRLEMTEPEWFDLFDEHDNPLEAAVYLAIEFQDANQDGVQKRSFTMNSEKESYYLHILTVGVRGVRGGVLP
eukprot:UN19447